MVGAMDREIMDWLRAEKKVGVENAAVTVTRGELSHAGRAEKVGRGAALDDADLDRLPENIARPRAVLYDKERPGELVYVFDPAGDRGRKGKVVVRVNYTAKLKFGNADRSGVTTNSVRSAEYVQAGDLPVSRYERIEGTVG